MAVRLSTEAEAELDAIWLFVACQSNSTEIANRLIDAITGSIWLLGRQPRLGRRRDSDLRSGLRSLPVGEYVIVYRLQGEEALILHVMRGSRDIEGLLGG